jgi:hypothetical protein
MIRTLLTVSAALTIVVFCGALVTADSKAVAADSVVLQVDAPRIDGAVQFSAPSAPGWSWRCTRTSCKVGAARGTVFTIVAEDGATSRFLRWEGACASNGAGNTCTVAADTDVTYVKAEYSRPRLWLAAFGAGSIVVESARPGFGPPAWWSCGRNCREYEFGELLRLRAVRTSSNFRMTGWGGACTRARPNYNCVISMRQNYFVSATFEPPPPPPVRCDADEPGKSCDPVSSPIRFTVAVHGRGTVVAPRMWDLQGLTCRSFCGGLYRYRDNVVALTATEFEGRPFLRWGGTLCAGTQPTCRFVYRRNDRRPREIKAYFGS